MALIRFDRCHPAERRFAILDELVNRLRDLRRRDRARKVFGASKHRYLSTPVTPSDVARFEADLGVALPPEYAAFLQRVGYGAGPYYGIWSPDESLAELHDLADDYEQETGITVRPALPFPPQSPIRPATDLNVAAGAKPSVATHDWPCSGCVPICHHGCTFWSVLVLNGDFVGRVWDVASFEHYTGEWIASRRPPGMLDGRTALDPFVRPPTFEEWFVGWLDQCETDVSPSVPLLRRLFRRSPNL